MPHDNLFVVSLQPSGSTCAHHWHFWY